MVSGVRKVLRTYNVNMIPKIHGFFMADTVNKWGDIYLIDVQYHTRGWRAVYGGHHEMADDGINTTIKWTCYMD